jgi:hypothetical protein
MAQKRSRSNPQGCQSATARPPTESCSAISHPARRYRKRLRWRRPVRKRRHSFLSFPYVCPEPVLVKRSFVSIKWSKRGVFLPSRGRTLSHRSAQHRSIPTGKSDRCWVHFQNHRVDSWQPHTVSSRTHLTVDVLRKTPLFFEFSLCLSRACLGKMFVLMYKWRKKWRFSHHQGHEDVDAVDR